MGRSGPGAESGGSGPGAVSEGFRAGALSGCCALTCRDRWLVSSGRSPGNSRRSMPPQSTTPSWEQAQSRGQLMVAGPGPGSSRLRTSTGSSSTNSFSSGLRLWAPCRPNTGALTASTGPSGSCGGSSSRSSSALLRAMVPAGGLRQTRLGAGLASPVGTAGAGLGHRRAHGARGRAHAGSCPHHASDLGAAVPPTSSPQAPIRAAPRRVGAKGRSAKPPQPSPGRAHRICLLHGRPRQH